MKSKRGVIQIIVAAGITIVIAGFFWIAATAPVSSLTAMFLGLPLDSDIMGTVFFFDVLIKVLPLLIGLSVTAWGWVKTVEERETGFSSW